MPQSVGVIIKNKNGKILMIDRKNPPPGWACPAGHIDEGEKPEEALKREVREEVNLDLVIIKELFREYVPWNNCRRHQGHEWTVYEAEEWTGEPKMDEREAKDMQWVAVGDLADMDLEEVWRYWFGKLGMLPRST